MSATWYTAAFRWAGLIWDRDVIGVNTPAMSRRMRLVRAELRAAEAAHGR